MSALHTGRLYPREYSWYSLLSEAVSTPGPKCDRKDFMSKKNPLTPAGIEPKSSMTYLNYKDKDDNSDDITISHNTVLQNTTVPSVALKCCV